MRIIRRKMTLELELLIAAWDNYKKNGIMPRPDGIFTETELIIDEAMMDLFEKSEFAETREATHA